MTAHSGRLVVVNPLPHTLAHYLEALREQVGQPIEGAAVVEPSIEIGGRSLAAKVVAAARSVLRLLRLAIAREPLLVLWPVFGLADLAMWRALGRGRRRLVVIHDPTPLRRQHGHGRIGKVFGRWGSRGAGVEVVVHTELAAKALAELSIPVRHVLAHPTAAPIQRPHVPVTMTVRVLGQFKDARDISLLEQIGQVAPSDWDLRIVGRGWPEVSGWRVTNRFLSEEKLEAEMDTASVVLVPYRHYFQSGIASRAYERGVPTVARRHEFIESLYGPAWPGLVDAGGPGCWLEAIRSAAPVPVTPRVSRSSVAEAWRKALGPAEILL